MRNKNNVPPKSEEKSEAEKKVESVLGPPPADAAPGGGSRPARPNEVITPDSTGSSVPEPASAPIIPTEKLPKDIINPPKTESAPAAKAEVTKPVASSDQTFVTPREVPDADDAETDKAIDEITAQESDEVLAAEDAEIARAFEPPPPKKGVFGRLKDKIADFWRDSKKRNIFLSVVLVVLIGLAVVPTTRYFLLNAIGVRSSASLRIIDSSTQQPLRNVRVSMAERSAVTDRDGHVRLEHLKLGKTDIVVQRRAFADINRQITIGWGSNPLGEFQIVPTGSQYTFLVSDFLSGEPVDAEASSSGVEAIADDEGKIVLTVDETDNTELEVVISAEEYRDEVMTMSLDTDEVQELTMVPSRKHVFVSQRSGEYDVYKIDIDGDNEEMLLPGTGSERDDMVLAPHPVDDAVAVVSTRNNIRNDDGFLMSTLMVIDTETDQAINVTESEQIHIIGWIGDRLVYVEVAAGASGSDPDRHRLSSIDYKTEEKTELASSNYFNDMVIIEDDIYYAPSGTYQPNEPSFYRVAADGGGQHTILDQEVWNIFRTRYDGFDMAAGQDWYTYFIGDDQADQLGGAPADTNNRVYQNSPDKKRSIWVDKRDGQGVIVLHNVENHEEEILKSQSGLSNPIYWLNGSYIVYRINTDQETADYALNLDGGEPVKIRDVTDTGGIDRWYYY